MADLDCDILVAGNSLGGVAAALSAARGGKNVVLLAASNWLGGQMTSQGVCTPDENEYIETTGSTRSYREFRQRTRQYYQQQYQLSNFGKSSVNAVGHLNLGQCWVNLGYAVEPKVGKEIFKQMLDEAGVRVIYNALVTNIALAEDGNSIVSVDATASDGSTMSIAAKFVLDATDLGDLLPLANVEHLLGAESRDQTSEPDAAADGPHRNWIQPITFPIALERMPLDEDHTIAKPANYEAVRDAQKFSLIDGNINGMFVPRTLPTGQRGLAFWTYRRVVAAGLFEADSRPFAGDVATINAAGNDYLDGVIPTGDPQSDEATLAAARQASLCYIYWLQTECPRDAGDGSSKGYPNLRPVTDFWDTSDGIAPDAYIREGRRIQAVTTILEQDIVAEDAGLHDIQTGTRAKPFPDSCGIGHYGMDIHATNVGELEYFLATKPFQIPLGALVPVRVTNLLPACKNLGVTHLTNGAYRLHPIEWNVGESAGALAAFCIERNEAPQSVITNPDLIRAYQMALLGQGVPIFWWSDVPDTDPCFAAANILGVQKVFAGVGGLAFAPDDELTEASKAILAQRAGRSIDWPAGPITRRDAAIILAAGPA